MKYCNLLVILLLISGCASHQSYDTSQFRNRDLNSNKIALDKDGLSFDQIKMIASTKPPEAYPVDLAIIIMINGDMDSEIEYTFKYEIVKELKNYRNIKRITVIPDFLIPNQLDFNTIQELGVRSLSEYTLVLHVNSSDIFNWTRVVDSEYEVHSAVDYIVVDSFTAAMLASDNLFSKQTYKTRIFELDERKKAQKVIFSEQGKLLSKKIEILFNDDTK